jgi:hypothetical protein
LLAGASFQIAEDGLRGGLLQLERHGPVRALLVLEIHDQQLRFDFVLARPELVERLVLRVFFHRAQLRVTDGIIRNGDAGEAGAQRHGLFVVEGQGAAGVRRNAGDVAVNVCGRLRGHGGQGRAGHSQQQKSQTHEGIPFRPHQIGALRPRL